MVDSGFSHWPGGRNGTVLGAVSLLSQHRQVARLRARNRGRGPTRDGIEQKVGEVKGTQEKRIRGDNVHEYRKRVQRMQNDTG